MLPSPVLSLDYSHALTVEFDPIGVVDEVVANGVDERGLADCLMAVDAAVALIVANVVAICMAQMPAAIDAKISEMLSQTKNTTFLKSLNIVSIQRLPSFDVHSADIFQPSRTINFKLNVIKKLRPLPSPCERCHGHGRNAP